MFMVIFLFSYSPPLGDIWIIFLGKGNFQLHVPLGYELLALVIHYVHLLIAVVITRVGVSGEEVF